MTDNARESIAFVGDSLIEGGRWDEWFQESEVLSFGVPGATTDDLLKRLDEIVQADPDELVLLIGTEDLSRRGSVEHVVRNIETALVTLRKELPGTRLLLVSILPRGHEFAERIQEANRHLWQFVATVHGQYLDAWPALALEDGELNPMYTADRLHLNDQGYEAWLAELRPALARLRDQPPMSGVITLPRLHS
ncbi:GDSL-type esterase/lipase family protein [Lysobacter korlensis]|uniref:GDSL-type esterase/lipase family protein n=1 Tax=Lysobacter korlensis TaxID=553636 RepID=A0ABV6S186_9GAMM